MKRNADHLMRISWAPNELRKIAETDDLHIAPFREDGQTYGTPTWIWSVVVDGELYVRAYGAQPGGNRASPSIAMSHSFNRPCSVMNLSKIARGSPLAVRGSPQISRVGSARRGVEGTRQFVSPRTRALLSVELSGFTSGIAPLQEARSRLPSKGDQDVGPRILCVGRN